MKYLVGDYGEDVWHPETKGEGWFADLEDAGQSAVARSMDNLGSFMCVYEFDDDNDFSKIVGVAIDGELFSR